jgi:hypothetical protein
VIQLCGAPTLKEDEVWKFHNRVVEIGKMNETNDLVPTHDEHKRVVSETSAR